MARKAFTDHRDFMSASAAANAALSGAASALGVEAILQRHGEFDARANRLVDDLTRLLLSCMDKRT